MFEKGGGLLPNARENFKNLNPGNGICSILRTHFVKKDWGYLSCFLKK
jgi:hypothetical protein